MSDESEKSLMAAPNGKARVIAAYCDNLQVRMKLTDNEIIIALEQTLAWRRERRR